MCRPIKSLASRYSTDIYESDVHANRQINRSLYLIGYTKYPWGCLKSDYSAISGLLEYRVITHNQRSAERPVVSHLADPRDGDDSAYPPEPLHRYKVA